MPGNPIRRLPDVVDEVIPFRFSAWASPNCEKGKRSRQGGFMEGAVEGENENEKNEIGWENESSPAGRDRWDEERVSDHDL